MNEYKIIWVGGDLNRNEVTINANDRTDLLKRLEAKNIYDYQIGCIIKKIIWVKPDDYNIYIYINIKIN
jgi:hypothetical protein